MDYEDFYHYVSDRIVAGQRNYLIFDELQMVEHWEKAVESFRLDFDVDIYITGSNAYLLSAEFSTLLSGRYVEIRLMPLSFKEFLDFYPFARDVLERNKAADQALLRKVVMSLADNIGCMTSPNSIGNVLSAEGDIDRGKSKGKSKNSVVTKTVDKYITMLKNAFIFYSVGRYDIKGKQYLKTLGKNHIIDLGFRNMLLGYRDADRGHILENIVYLELIRRNYKVSIGKVGETEVDFVAEKPDEKLYIQVTETMEGETTRARELRPLQLISDNYEKIVLSMDKSYIKSYDGIKSLNIIDFLLGQ